MTLRCPHKERTAFLKMRDMFSGKITVSQKASTVLVSFQRFVVQCSKQLVFIDLRSDS